MPEVKTTRVKLDWSRLLGFDQANPSGTGAEPAKISERDLSKLGTKTGTKPGVKVGVKVGVKLGVKTGVKIAG